MQFIWPNMSVFGGTVQTSDRGPDFASQKWVSLLNGWSDFNEIKVIFHLRTFVETCFKKNT
jgi:hypothetical protein